MTVRVAVAGVPVDTCPCVGFKLQVGRSCAAPAPWKATAQVKFTVPENPPADEACMVAVAEPPEEAVIPVEGVETETVDPVPDSVTVCGELGALSLIVRVPVRAPPAVGAKVIEIVQLALGAMLPLHVSDSEKFPTVCVAKMLRGAFPELVSVMVCAALVEPTACEGKLSVDGERVTAGTGRGVV